MNNIIVFNDEEWEIKSAETIINYIRLVSEYDNICNIMLTGGRSAKGIYRKLPSLLENESCVLNFYFGDERCVMPDDPASNYRMANESLFSVLKCKSFHIHRIMGEAEPYREVERYSKILPRSIDILLLSIGEDGHIASLFPGDYKSINDSGKLVMVKAPKEPIYRISVTKNVIDNSSIVFCFARGEEKGRALISVFKGEHTIEEVPARIVKNCIWLIDKSSEAVLRHNFIF
jgi:6-phosphogluconolactonase